MRQRAAFCIAFAAALYLIQLLLRRSAAGQGIICLIQQSTITEENFPRHSWPSKLEKLGYTVIKSRMVVDYIQSHYTSLAVSWAMQPSPPNWFRVHTDNMGNEAAGGRHDKVPASYYIFVNGAGQKPPDRQQENGRPCTKSTTSQSFMIQIAKLSSRQQQDGKAIDYYCVLPGWGCLLLGRAIGNHQAAYVRGD